MAPTTLVLSATALQAIFGVDAAALTPGQTGKAMTTNLTFTETPSPAYNVVAVIPGSDPALKGQYVAIGAHNDHVGYNHTPVDHDSLRAFQRAAWTMAGAYAGLPALNAQQRASIHVNVDSLHKLRPARLDSIANGADDDGSGSMAVLEIAENISKLRVKPKRSILFVWHTGEEKGLLGSQWISNHFPVSRDSIVAQINIDMIGRGDSVDVKGGGPRYVGVVGAKRLSSMLGATVDSLAKAEKTPIDLDYRMDTDGHPENIYCRSDHYNYARWGIPVAFFFTGLHGDYHQVTDEPQYIDYPHYSLIANYIKDLLVAVSNGARPAVDKPKPDPNGQCRQ
jgi:Zn-dependent M28 family amino/carboxypeptidase